MIGMGFGAFLTLLIISFIAAIVIHSGIRYRFLNGVDGFFAKWILGWLGAWVATPVLGYWFAGVEIGGQYIIPAFVGAFSAAFMTAAVCKMVARTRTAVVESPEMATSHARITSEVAHGGRAA